MWQAFFFLLQALVVASTGHCATCYSFNARICTRLSICITRGNNEHVVLIDEEHGQRARWKRTSQREIERVNE